MPQEKKKRGRREEAKRKRQDEEGAQADDQIRADPSSKRPRSEAEALPVAVVDDGFIAFPENVNEPQEHDTTSLDPGAFGDTEGLHTQREFYGLLTEDEQAYFKRADDMLELNQFADPEERELFQNSVWQELDGKELKVANSQSCSRFLERLIKMSNTPQLKKLFGKFKGQFLHLVQHRFASHVCEALFLQAAPAVTEELVDFPDQKQPNLEFGEAPEHTLEDLFLSVVKELEENMGYLMTESFASHSLRVLLLILSGKPLEGTTTAAVLKSKSKEKIEIPDSITKPSGNSTLPRSVPDSFHTALKRMISSIVGGLDTNYLRALATQPVGNPVIQLMLEVEFSIAGKGKAKDERSIFRKLLPEEVPDDGTQSAAFIKGLLYDPVGSRLLETIVKNAPGKVFKAIYRTQFQKHLQNIVRNEVASYVVMRVLERLSHENLKGALDALCPEIPALLERSRTSVIKTMIEQAHLREVNTDQIAVNIVRAVGSPGSESLLNLLQFSPHADDATNMSNRRHASLLADSMVKSPGPLQEFVFEGLLNLNGRTLLMLSCDKAATFVVQSCLLVEHKENSFLRKLVPNFQGYQKDMAIHPIGSHVLDAIWTATGSLFFLRERIAEDLSSYEEIIKESYVGRAVWRNWAMDTYKRNRTRWVAEAKESANQSRNSIVGQEKARSQNQYAHDRRSARGARLGPKQSSDGHPKTAIEIAREKFAARKAAGQRKQTRQTVATT